ncbi:FAD-dependent oxidoreductase [Pelagerythrobacter rhizovicinus]|uniref:D-amino-acid oxidase n=1 Tax=Pelagerythrobacter rhizovicinus TaxID=2268576 RepID=A0A4Q2KS33_9SPHN|nr:FAD-dependent oxidoreductase [Pelagerythrobacter rhizovicinus]RXZ66161.1 FAD-binding oxidoreductase [Pelagerythrobacter rhizovicinus]
MKVERRTVLVGSAAALLAGCTRTGGALTSAPTAPRLAPLHFDAAHLMKITVCLRPFRPAGPRLEAERFGEKTVVHNYGHGGSGWSLSWGCAAEATTLARSGGAGEFAVIGAGVIGLTTALRLVETGAKVTIYAEEFPAETRSARATGVWSPSSRIALADGAPDGFAERWESWARIAHAAHLRMVGLPGDPVEFLPEYEVSGGESGASPPAAHDFLHLNRRVRDLRPPWRRLEPGENPFAPRDAATGQGMVFNVASYADRLAQLFMLRGGRMIRRAFPDRTAVLALPETVIVNCMGYGAKDIWGDSGMVPVRGQIGWLIPQPEARYAVYYGGVNAISRRDGVVIQYYGPNEDFGYGDPDEIVDRVETERALEILRGVYLS